MGRRTHARTYSNATDVEGGRTAYHALRETGIKACCMLEARPEGWGTSGRFLGEGARGLRLTQRGRDANNSKSEGKRAVSF